MASTKDGNLYPVEVVGTAVRDDQGELKMIVIISRKTQERQRFEAQLLMAKSNNERLVDHMEQRMLPELERSIKRLEGSREEAIPEILEEMRATLHIGRQALEAMPPPEEAQNLRPVSVDQVLKERLPAMVARHRVAEKRISVSVKASEKDLMVMANDMLPDLIVRILEVLMEMGEFKRPTFTISVEGRKVSDVRGSRTTVDKEGREPSIATISIACPGLLLSDELRAILSRQELHTLGPLTPEQALAVETSRLLLFLYEGRIVIEKAPITGEESVMVLLRQV
jgi:hypothetical protein